MKSGDELEAPHTERNQVPNCVAAYSELKCVAIQQAYIFLYVAGIKDQLGIIVKCNETKEGGPNNVRACLFYPVIALIVFCDICGNQ